MCVFRLILQVVNTSTWRLRRWSTAVARDPRKTDSWYNVIFACAGSTAHALEWKRKTRLEHFPKFRRCTTFHLNWRGSRRFFRQIADAVTKLNVFSLWPLDVALSLLSIFFCFSIKCWSFWYPMCTQGSCACAQLYWNKTHSQNWPQVALLSVIFVLVCFSEHRQRWMKYLSIFFS